MIEIWVGFGENEESEFVLILFIELIKGRAVEWVNELMMLFYFREAAPRKLNGKKGRGVPPRWLQTLKM